MTAAARRVQEMAETHAAAWTAGDVAGTGTLFAEDAELSVNGAPPHMGRTAIMEAARALMATFPGVTVRAHDTRRAGNRAVFIWTLEGRHAETGNTVLLPGWHEWDLNENDEVRRCRGFFDAADLERQIGAT